MGWEVGRGEGAREGRREGGRGRGGFEARLCEILNTPLDAMLFDVALVGSAICDSSRGKAAGLDMPLQPRYTSNTSNVSCDVGKIFQSQLAFSVELTAI